MPRPSPTNIWLSAVGVQLPICAPVPGTPDLIDFWWPLHRAARSAWAARAPWAIHLDEFRLVGQFWRTKGSAIWIYFHDRSRAEIYVDPGGQTYRLKPFTTDPTKGRFSPCDIRTAVWQAHLPLVSLDPPPFPDDLDGGEGPIVDLGQQIGSPRRIQPGDSLLDAVTPSLAGSTVRRTRVRSPESSTRGYPCWPPPSGPFPGPFVDDPFELDEFGRCHDEFCEQCRPELDDLDEFDEFDEFERCDAGLCEMCDPEPDPEQAAALADALAWLEDRFGSERSDCEQYDHLERGRRATPTPASPPDGRPTPTPDPPRPRSLRMVRPPEAGDAPPSSPK